MHKGESRRHIKSVTMTLPSRITIDSTVMDGKPCIRGMRVTVGTILGLLASSHTHAQILAAYPVS